MSAKDAVEFSNYMLETSNRLPHPQEIWDAALDSRSLNIPTIEEVQQAVIDAQLCNHGEVEVTVLVKWVYEFICRKLQARS